MSGRGGDRAVGNTTDASAVVIWLHGLGDTPDGWADQMEALAPALPHVRFELPLAPTQPVECNGGASMTSWMDLSDIPIGLATPDEGRQQEASLARVLAAVNAAGVPPARVVVGGFSQGGAMALATTLKAPAALGGCVCFSGWPLPFQKLADAAPASAAAQGATRFLVCHGDADQVVLPECGAEVARLLDAAGFGERAAFRTYRGMAHSSCREEERELAAFLARVLPPA